jgi:hypothetical protein
MLMTASRRTSSELNARLRARRPEMEDVALTRLRAIPDQGGPGSAEYVDGLRQAVAAVIDLVFATIERGGHQSSLPIPVVLINQARLAAREGKGVESVLRRYFAGHALLTDFVVCEAEEMGLSGGHLQQLLRDLSALFDRLAASASSEYMREEEDLARTSRQHRARRIQGLLDGEPLDTSDLRYDFDGHHLGVVANARIAGEALRELSRDLDRRLLLVCRAGKASGAGSGGGRTSTRRRSSRSRPDGRPA